MMILHVPAFAAHRAPSAPFVALDGTCRPLTSRQAISNRYFSLSPRCCHAFLRVIGVIFAELTCTPSTRRRQNTPPFRVRDLRIYMGQVALTRLNIVDIYGHIAYATDEAVAARKYF